ESTNYRLNIVGHPMPKTTNRSDVDEDGAFSPVVKEFDQAGLRAVTSPVVKEVPQGVVRELAPQYTVDKKKNVNVGLSKETDDPTGEADLRLQVLVRDILDVCRDHHSTGSYIQLARNYPEYLIREALSLTRDHAARGRIKKSRGAYFTDTLR